MSTVLEDKSSDLKKMVSELNSKLEEFKTTPKKSKISDKVIKDSTSTEYDAYEDDT